MGGWVVGGTGNHIPESPHLPASCSPFHLPLPRPPRGVGWGGVVVVVVVGGGGRAFPVLVESQSAKIDNSVTKIKQQMSKTVFRD